MSTLHQLAIGLNVTEKALLSWNKNFNINPTMNKLGQLVYSDEQKKLVLRIHHLLKVRKFTIPGAKQELKRLPLDKKRDETIKKLNNIRVLLCQLRDDIK